MTELPTKRIAFTVHYDGSAYFGWQLQPAHRSVQGELERVLGKLFDRPARVIGSGRTDRGVHATGQVASVDAPVRWSGRELRRAMNALLPDDVWIAAAAEVAPDFHPRFGALRRDYVYRLGTRPGAWSPFHARWCWPVPWPLDRARLEEETAAIVGDHSFLAFAKAGQEERGDRCVVFEARWAEREDVGLEFHIGANRFLHHMVRYLVGTLVGVAAGHRGPGDLERMLRGDRSLETSPPAPAKGLFLTAVHYPSGAYPGAGGGPEIASTEWNRDTIDTRTR